MKDGSLPKQRFGASYWVRCRVVDPAGNSLSAKEPDPKDFSTAIGCGDQPYLLTRHEPVPAPVVLLPEQLDLEHRPGEQLDRMVVRDGEFSARERVCAPPRAT